MTLCDYSDMFGKPGVGAHKHFMGIAMTDVLVSILVALVFSLYMGTDPVKTAAGVFVIGVFAHWLFCVPTAANVAMGIA